MKIQVIWNASFLLHAEHLFRVQTFVRFFRMYWREEMGRELPQEIGRDLTNINYPGKKIIGIPQLNFEAGKCYVDPVLEEFNLDLTGKSQPSVNIDDLLFTIYHLLAAYNIAFPTVRTLFQLNTLNKMMASTSARPGTLVRSLGYAKGNDALK